MNRFFRLPGPASHPLLVAMVIGFFPISVTATEPPRLQVSGLSIANGSAPQVDQLTAGHQAEIHFEANWTSGRLDRVGLDLLVDGASIHVETLEFRDRMGTFQSRFLRRVTLPVSLSGGSHTLELRCTGVAQFRGGSVNPIDSPPASIKFTSAGVPGINSIASVSASPKPMSLAELRQLYQQRTHETCAALARRFCALLGAPYDPNAIRDSWRSTSGMGMVGGIQSHYTISNGSRLLRELNLTVTHQETTPATESIRTADNEMRTKRSPSMIADWNARRAAAHNPTLTYWDIKYSGMSAPADATPRPPPLSLVQGPVLLGATGKWAISTALGPNIGVDATASTSAFHELQLTTKLNLPESLVEQIRAKFYPLPPGLSPKDARQRSDDFDAELKRTRQDAGRTLVRLFTDAALAYTPLLEGGPVDPAAEQRLADWQPSIPSGVTPPSAPASVAVTPPTAPPSTTRKSGVQFDAGLLGLPSATSPRPTTPAQRLLAIGEQSAARAAAIVDQAIPSADGLSEIEVAILAEAALTDQDPAAVLAELAADEMALNESGNGDGLQIVNTSVRPERPDPGTTVEVTLTVRNVAAPGPPAIFDVGLCDYHNENRDVVRLQRCSLAPGDSARFSLRFTAPRAYNFGGYAYVDPLLFRGDVLPQEVINLRINWDGSTMTDQEIAAELREHNPCPDHFPLTAERLDRFIALYRANSNEALAAVERESIAAQREQMQADYLARFYDPARIEQIQRDIDAAQNTKQLAAYKSLRNLAYEWGYIHHLDLVGILDDTVYIDENARVHGDVADARRKIFRAIEDKQNNPGAVQALLLADPNDKSGHTQAYREFEPVITPAVNAASFLNLGDATTDAITQKAIAELRQAGNRLLGSVRNPNLPAYALTEEIRDLRVVLRAAQDNLKVVDSPILRDAIKKLSDQASKFEGMIEQAKTFQQRAAKVLGATKAARTIGKAISNVGEIWSLYDLSEKILARTNGGEDFAVAIGKETGNWGAKKLVLGNPLIGAADLTMTVTGHLLKTLGPEYWEELGIDPTQYNASTLVDIGTSVTFAGVEDMSRIYAQRGERLPPLTPAERGQLEARLAAFEARLETTPDETLRQRLMVARANVRQTLRDRR